MIMLKLFRFFIFIAVFNLLLITLQTTVLSHVILIKTKFFYSKLTLLLQFEKSKTVSFAPTIMKKNLLNSQ